MRPCAETETSKDGLYREPRLATKPGEKFHPISRCCEATPVRSSAAYPRPDALQDRRPGNVAAGAGTRAVGRSSVVAVLVVAVSALDVRLGADIARSFARRPVSC